MAGTEYVGFWRWLLRGARRYPALAVVWLGIFVVVVSQFVPMVWPRMVTMLCGLAVEGIAVLVIIHQLNARAAEDQAQLGPPAWDAFVPPVDTQNDEE